MKKANLTLDGQSTGLTIVDRFPFDDVDFVFDALFGAFHPTGIGDGEDDHADPRFVALWTLFLSTAGWTEPEFWAEAETRRETCPDCGKKMNAEGNPIEGDTTVKAAPNPKSN